VADQCGHCGRLGALEHVKDVAVSSRPTTITETHGDDPRRYEREVADQQILSVRRCTVCEGLTLGTYRYVDDWSDPSDFMDWQDIYPARKPLEALPDRVRERYLQMLELLHAPDAFAVRAGRLLEAVCAERGVAKGVLRDRIDLLVEQADVPAALVEQAHLVRRYRNFGGHDDDIEVEEADVPLIRDFAETLLDYLYWGPEKLAQGKGRLEERRARATE
jgi:hypothetical protein